MPIYSPPERSGGIVTEANLNVSKPDLLAILRAAATDFDVDEFLARPGAPAVEEIWHRGETGPLRRRYETSGFSLTIADVGISEQVFGQIHVRLSELSPILMALRAQHVELTLDVGIMLQVGEHLSTELSVSFEELRFLAGLEVSLVISPYLCIDS